MFTTFQLALEAIQISELRKIACTEAGEYHFTQQYASLKLYEDLNNIGTEILEIKCQADDCTLSFTYTAATKTISITSAYDTFQIESRNGNGYKFNFNGQFELSKLSDDVKLNFMLHNGDIDTLTHATFNSLKAS